MTRISRLSDHPAFLPVLARWFEDEWAPWYGPEGDGDATTDLTACLDPADLPLCLVALSGGGEPVGTASLRRSSVGSDQFSGIWLSAVLVAPDHRRQGIGLALIDAAEREARHFAPEALYVSTDWASGHWHERNWERVGEAGSLRGTVDIWRAPGS